MPPGPPSKTPPRVPPPPGFGTPTELAEDEVDVKLVDADAEQLLDRDTQVEGVTYLGGYPDLREFICGLSSRTRSRQPAAGSSIVSTMPPCSGGSSATARASSASRLRLCARQPGRAAGRRGTGSAGAGRLVAFNASAPAACCGADTRRHDARRFRLREPWLLDPEEQAKLAVTTAVEANRAGRQVVGLP